jgi:hypothetical protein
MEQAIIIILLITLLNIFCKFRYETGVNMSWTKKSIWPFLQYIIPIWLILPVFAGIGLVLMGLFFLISLIIIYLRKG